MAGEELFQQIDVNKDKCIEERELLDFLDNEENLQAVGNHLNENWRNQRDALVLAIKDITNAIFQSFPQIRDKVRNNQPLTADERKVMKLQYMLDKE